MRRRNLGIAASAMIALMSIFVAQSYGVMGAGQHHGYAAAIGTAGVTPPPNSRVPDSDNPELIARQSPSQASVGIPAISPHPDHQPGQPAFSEQDVRTYLKSHPIQFADLSKSLPSIVSIKFMTVSDAERELQTSLDQHPANDLVCVVMQSGIFIVFAPAGFPPEKGTLSDMVFDAETGNLLVEGVEDLK